MNTITKAASSGSSSFDSDIKSLLDGWIEAERNGVQFPVPLHDHWDIAGHKYKKNAFELVESLLEEGLDFSLPTGVRSANGRKQKAMMLSVAALEHFCMAAHTAQGKDVRELYRQSKAKWDLVKQVSPELAAQIELIAEQKELEKLRQQTFQAEQQKILAEQSKVQAEQNLISFRHLVTTTMPEVKQQIILGHQIVEKIEYRDRVIRRING